MRVALEGRQRAYFVFPIAPGILQATAYFAQAAKETGVDGVVNMSQISARREAESNAARDHWFAEQVFDWSGASMTHIRLTFFAEWILNIAPMVRAGVIRLPFGSGRHAPVAVEDQARVIVGILEDPASHRGKVYPLFNPVELNHEEISQAVGRALGKDIRYEQVSFDAFLEGAKARGRKFDSFFAQHLREVVLDHQNGVFAGKNDLIAQIGSRLPLTVESFVQKHREAFS